MNYYKREEVEPRIELSTINTQTKKKTETDHTSTSNALRSSSNRSSRNICSSSSSWMRRKRIRIPHSIQSSMDFIKLYASFIGPGFLISVAYMDPGNYSTDISAGVNFRYSLLFIVLLANLIAIYLQSLATRLGSVTGKDLAQNCKEALPFWLNVILWIFAEIAIIATDLAEVLGAAIAINLLSGLPIVYGVLIMLVDVLIILLFYRPDRMTMTFGRAFEAGIAVLVLGVVGCFIAMLVKIADNIDAKALFRGYLPSSTVAQGSALYISMGIMGATVMPHSLYLGSSLTKARLRDYDIKNGNHVVYDDVVERDQADQKYRPSLSAIKYTINYATIEISLSLLTFAFFVNSSILITGATLWKPNGEVKLEDADIHTIYNVLSTSVGAAAGTIFAIALLLSGQSAGIVATMAGQVVAEGFLRWKIKPWVRRLATRSISIIPSAVIAASVGDRGVNALLNGSQVALSIVLPFTIGPLVYLCWKKDVMRVAKEDLPANRSEDDTEFIDMSIGKIVLGGALLIFAFICLLNGAYIVRTAMGK